jgi:hypothetical protein
LFFGFSFSPTAAFLHDADQTLTKEKDTRGIYHREPSLFFPFDSMTSKLSFTVMTGEYVIQLQIFLVSANL